MSSAAPARDTVGRAAIAFFGLALGSVGLHGLCQGHVDPAVTRRGQPLGFGLHFGACMPGTGAAQGAAQG